MKFKHTFHVFVDNFSVTYKQLLYRLIVSLVALGAYIAIITPFIKAITGSQNFKSLLEGVRLFIKNLTEGNSSEMSSATQQIKDAVQALLHMVTENRADIIWGIVGIVAVHLVSNFFTGLGNYATASVINDKMALRAQTPFFNTLIRNLKEASLYNLMYVPLSFAYDALCCIVLYLIVFKLFSLLPFIFLPLQIFLFATAVVFVIAVKLTLTSDWLPALIRGKLGQKKAFLYAFDRRRKNTFNVLSNFIVITLIIFALNVGAIICTFGVAGLITIPSSYVILVAFQFVNYYEREELKYFIDKKTIIKPEKEKVITREEFFKGE